MTLESTIPTPAPVAVAAPRDASAAARATAGTSAPSFVKNLGFLLSGDLVAKAFTFVAFAFLARTLGPENFGRVEFALAFTFALSLVIDFGFGLAGARDAAAGDVARLRSIVTRVVSDRLWFAIPSLAAALLFVFAVPAAREMRGLLLLFACSLLPAPFILQWAFQGRGLMQYVGLTQTLRFAVFAVIVLLGVRSAADLWLVAAAEIAGVAAAAVFCAIVCRRLFGFLPPLLPRPIDGASLARATPIGLSQLFWAVKYVFVTVLVGLLMTKEDVGQFGVALRVTVALHAFVALYFYNVLPAAAAAHARSSTALDEFIGSAVRGSTWIAIPAACLAVIFAPPAVRIVFGDSYADAAAPVLQVQVVALALALLSAHFRATLIACHRTRAELLSTATGAAVQVAVTLVCYRRYGLLAAAWGMLAGELCTLVLSVGIAERRLLGTRLRRQLLPHAAVVAAVVAVLILLAAQPAWLRAALALLAIAAGVMLLDRASLIEWRRALVPHRATHAPPGATCSSVNTDKHGIDRA